MFLSFRSRLYLFLVLEKIHVLFTIFSFCQLNQYVIWLSENFPALFNKKCRINILHLFNSKTSFTFRSTDLIPCNRLYSTLSIIYIYFLIIIILKQVPISHIYLIIHLFGNFESVHEKLRYAC